MKINKKTTIIYITALCCLPMIADRSFKSNNSLHEFESATSFIDQTDVDQDSTLDFLDEQELRDQEVAAQEPAWKIWLAKVSLDIMMGAMTIKDWIILKAMTFWAKLQALKPLLTE